MRFCRSLRLNRARTPRQIAVYTRVFTAWSSQMGFYSDSVVPRLVTCACGTKPILKQREKIVPKAAGRVLEIGMGAGHNLPYYRPEQIQGIVGIDPCSTSWKLAQPRAAELGVPSPLLKGRLRKCHYLMVTLIR